MALFEEFSIGEINGIMNRVSSIGNSRVYKIGSILAKMRID